MATKDGLMRVLALGLEPGIGVERGGPSASPCSLAHAQAENSSGSRRPGVSPVPHYPNEHARGSSRAAWSAFAITGPGFARVSLSPWAPAVAGSLELLQMENPKAREGQQITGPSQRFAVITGSARGLLSSRCYQQGLTRSPDANPDKQ
ncbi:uncharacterized protein LOC144455020 [Phascolarctos cinereus]